MQKNSENIFDVIVVGGGASGMMAAGTAAGRNKKVLLLEKNKKLGEKLKITGGGRCNVTNAEFNNRELLKNYGESDKFLFSPFSQFSPKDTFEFFESRGLPLVVQARKRAFPHTEKAIDVYNVMEKYLKAGKVEIQTNSAVTKILIEGNKITGVMCGKIEYKADSYVFSTGGISHPETGSTGDGLNWLKKIGHTVADATPTIVPIATAEKWVHNLAGVSLSFMKITFFVDDKKAFSKTGKILFTHFGLSGPLILNSAKKVGDLLHTGLVTAKIDMYPDTDYDVLEKNILKTFEANKNKIFKNVLADFVPEGMDGAVLSLLPIAPETKVHSVTKEQRKKIMHLLKEMPVTITELMGFDRAVIADGGVTLEEIDMTTMRSKKIPNLFVTGDLLHINRRSGGFPLQLCWTTGFIAGSNA